NVRNAAKKRQLRGPLRSWPYYGDDEWDAVVGLVKATRPWPEEQEVAKRLRAWTRGDVELVACLDVAGELAKIGRQDDLGSWDDPLVAMVAMDMLHNVLLRRPPWELSSLREAPNVPARSQRRHRAEGMTYYYRRMVRERDRRELMEGGRSEAAARRW